MNQNHDTSRFTIRDRVGEPDALYMADAENLRVEKLSTRITLVAVLIPCLLVIVLAIAYLDIKHRVASTQNTGSMGVQNLSKDLESRFSSLSLKQAKLEEQLAEIAKALETATAGLQVNLKKATTELTRIADEKADRSTLAAEAKKTQASIAGLRKEVADLNETFNRFDEELAAQILIMAEGLKKDQGRLAEIEAKTRELDSEKLSKASMDLALGLERLALQEMVKERIREVEKKIASMGKQIDALDQRLDARRQAPPAAPNPSPSSIRPPDGPSGSDKIEEQTIN